MTPRNAQEKKFPKIYAQELLKIAEGDWNTAKALRGCKNIRIENIFYHAEQAIEKSLKAVLCHLEEPVPLVHELGALVAKFPQEMDLPFGYELDQLSQFATIRRYEEGKVELTTQEQDAVLKVSLEILDWARNKMRS